MTGRTLWSLVGLGGRAIAAVVLIVALSRAVGSEGYGVYAGITAFVIIFTTVATVGVNETMVRSVSRDPERAPRAWGATLRVSATLGLVISVATVLLATVILPGRSVTVIALLTVAEFLTTAVGGTGGRMCMALDRYRAFAAHHLADGAVRAGAAVIFWVSGSDDLRLLAVLLAGGAAVLSLGSTLWVARTVGRPEFRGVSVLAEAREGASFSLADVSSGTQQNVDKAMLLRYDFDAENGVYSAGYRLISYALLPLSAFFATTYPQFFRHGEAGVAPAWAYAKGLAKRVLGGSLLLAVLCIAVAPLAGWLFGGDFDDITLVVFAMGLFPFFRAAQVLAGDTLSGSGHQSWRARAQIVGAVVNVGANIWLIPRHGWQGAVAATYLSEVVYLELLLYRIRTTTSTTRAGASQVDAPTPRVGL